jgi:hypothetical protein
MMFVQTANIYWASEYMEQELKGDKYLVNKLFLVCILTGPIFGSTLGGIIITSLGGYTSSKSLYLCLGVHTIMTLVNISKPFFGDIYAFAVCVWLLTFCTSFMEPVLTGLLLHLVG